MTDFLSRFGATLAALLVFLAIAYALVHYELNVTIDRVEAIADEKIDTVGDKMTELSDSIKGFSVFGGKKK